MNRNEIIRKNVSLGLLFKSLNLLIVYITIPYLLLFLGKESYGIWVTIFSIISILFFVDAGISNGLKTKLTQAISLNNIRLSQEYVSTAYIAIGSIAIFFFVLGYLFLNFIELSSLLNISNKENEDILRAVFLITLIFVVTNFVLSLYKTLFYAVQKAAVIEFAMFLYQSIVLVLILYAVNNLTSSLNYVALVYGFSSVFIGIMFSIFFFSKNKKLIPKILFFRKERLKDLMGLSIDFFIIQLSMIIIFTTDNLLISNLLGPEEVANYDIVLKLFQVLITVSVIILEPFWALFSDAYQKNDLEWIKSTFKKLNKLFLVLIIAVVLLIFLTKSIIKIWIGNSIQIENLLIYLMGVFVLVRVYGIIYMFFLNGIGKIKFQKWLYIFGAVINIPLSIFLVKKFNLGSSGVILGTIFSIVIMSIILPIQTKNILSNLSKQKIKIGS